jgi:hypothetical protein
MQSLCNHLITKAAVLGFSEMSEESVILPLISAKIFLLTR